MQTTEPETKSQLIQSLQRTQINKFKVKDAITLKDLQDIQKELKSFIGNGQKPVSVIFLKGR